MELFEQCVISHNFFSEGNQVLKGTLLKVLDRHLKKEFPSHRSILDLPQFNGIYSGERQDIPKECYSPSLNKSYLDLFRILNTGEMDDELVGLDVEHSLDETLRSYEAAYGSEEAILHLTLELSLLKAWYLFSKTGEINSPSKKFAPIKSMIPIVIKCKWFECKRFIFTPTKRPNADFCRSICRHSYNNHRLRHNTTN